MVVVLTGAEVGNTGDFLGGGAGVLQEEVGKAPPYGRVGWCGGGGEVRGGAK